MSLSSFTHQLLPFERVVDDLAPKRDLARTPLYQAEFDMHDEGWTGTAIDPTAMTAFQQTWRVAKTDVCLYLQREDDGSWAGGVEYARALFDPGTIDRFARHYVQLLQAVAAEPDAPLSAVQFLTSLERELLLAHPPAGRRIYSLDGYGNLAPLGVPGEVYVGDPANVYGSMGDARSTAERFVPDPYGGRGERLYRTGELGRRRPDGSWEMLGRAAELVRVQDVLVDPATVAAALAAHPSVGEAAVVAYRPEVGGTRLRAYWVASVATEAGPEPVATAPRGPEGGTDATTLPTDLADHCRARLPEHEVPAELVRLDRLPRTELGEVDRQGLGVGELPHDLLLSDSSPDRSPDPSLALAEERVSEIWRELLGVEVDAGTSFFGLGGNSILGIQMIARIREDLGVEVPVRVFFEQPTVTAVAQAVEAQIRAELAGMSDEEVLAEATLPDDQE